MRIAVTGATGQLVRLVIASLKQKVPPGEIVALVRDPAGAAELRVEARRFDYNQPETLVPALEGIEKLLLISSSELGQRAAQHSHVIEAAKGAGVRHIFYTSLLHADASPLSLAQEHRETEDMLAKSALNVTLLRNGWYAENHTGAIPGALAAGGYIGSTDPGRISWAARADYAEAAATVLAGEGHEGKTYELAGDDAHTLADLAAEISAQTGKDIPYNDLPPVDYAAILVSAAGLPAPLAEAIASWDADAGQGALFDDGRTLSRLTGGSTTPLSAVVAAALG